MPELREETMKRTPLKRKTPLKRTPLKRVSKKRAKENKEYLQLVNRLLFECPHCEACATVALEFCNAATAAFKMANPNPSTQCHHRMGRGKYFLAYEWFCAVCDECHRTIEANKKWAREVNLILYK